MTVVSIMQPQYLPRPRYMAMLDQADLFVIYDTVEVNLKSWQMRANVQGRDGNRVLLSVPTNAKRGMPLSQVEVVVNGWGYKHRRTIEAAYSHTQGWPKVRELFREDAVLEPFLVDTDVACMTRLATTLGITTPIVKASSLGPMRTGRLERIADTLKAVDAEAFLATRGSEFLHGMDTIEGTPIRWHHWHPEPLAHTVPGFDVDLSVIHTIAHSGRNALPTIRSGFYDSTCETCAQSVRQ